MPPVVKIKSQFNATFLAVDWIVSRSSGMSTVETNSNESSMTLDIWFVAVSFLVPAYALSLTVLFQVTSNDRISDFHGKEMNAPI